MQTIRRCSYFMPASILPLLSPSFLPSPLHEKDSAVAARTAERPRARTTNAPWRATLVGRVYTLCTYVYTNVRKSKQSYEEEKSRDTHTHTHTAAVSPEERPVNAFLRVRLPDIRGEKKKRKEKQVSSPASLVNIAERETNDSPDSIAEIDANTSVFTIARQETGTGEHIGRAQARACISVNVPALTYYRAERR